MTQLININLTILLVSILGTINGKLITRTFSLSEAAINVLNSDGNLVRTKVQTDLMVCGIGKGVVYTRGSSGVCHDERSIAFKRGTVNQLSGSNERTIYTNSEVTVLDTSYIKVTDPILERCLIKSAKSGMDIDMSTISTNGDRTIVKIGSTLVISLSRGSSVTMKEEGLCCSCSSLACGITITAGNVGENVICHKGVGKVLFLLETRPGVTCSIGEHSCLPQETNALEKYLPTETTYIEAETIGMTYKSFLDWGVVTEVWFWSTLSKTERLRRFIDEIIAGIAYAMAEDLQEAMVAGWTTVGVNFRKVFDRLVYQNEKIFEQTVMLAQETVRKIQNDIVIGNIDIKSGMYQNILMMLSQKVDSMEMFALYFANYMQYKEESNTERLNEIEEYYKNVYSSEKVIKKLKTKNLITYYSTEGDITTGNCLNKKCTETNCQLSGSYKHYQKFELVTEESFPYLNIATCGLYFKGETVEEFYCVKNSETNEEAMGCFDPKTEVCYVTNMTCVDDIDYTNVLLKDLNRYGNAIGATFMVKGPGEYTTDCEDSELRDLYVNLTAGVNSSDTYTNYSTTNELLLSVGLSCNTDYDVQDMQKAIKNFKRVDFELENSLIIFGNRMGSAGLEELGEAFKALGLGIGRFFGGLTNSLFGVDSLSKMQIGLLISVVILYLGYGYLMYKFFSFDGIISKVKELRKKKGKETPEKVETPSTNSFEMYALDQNGKRVPPNDLNKV